MSVTIHTLDKLQSLEQLYRQGFHSQVIDQAIDKLLAMEIEQAQEDLRDLESRLAACEQRYNMPSEEFYRRFRAGEMGDEADFAEWSIFYDMRQDTLQRLKLLGVSTA